MAQSDIETGVPSITETYDPVLSDFELPLRAVFHPLGFTVEIATNSQEVIASAEESFGHFHRVFSEPPLQVRIGVLEGDSEECPPIPVCRGRRNLLINIADSNNFTVCDLRRGFGFGWVTPAAVANRAYFRYYLLECTVLTLLKSLYLTPLHAACVQLENRGVLLCGDSGAGKSSLAYACARSGWTFLSDDSGCLIRNRKDRLVVGDPYRMRFREASRELFPELEKQSTRLRATGEMAIELSTASMPEIQTALTGPVDYIVFLNRGEAGPPRLATFPKEIALPWFEKVICIGDRDVREAQAESLRRLLAVAVYELRYRGLDWAVDRLGRLVREGV